MGQVASKYEASKHHAVSLMKTYGKIGVRIDDAMSVPILQKYDRDDMLEAYRRGRAERIVATVEILHRTYWKYLPQKTP